MKKIKLFFVFFLTLAIGSCNYDFTEDIDLDAVTQGKVAKVFLGGNVDCSQLNLVSPDFEAMTLTTGRNDFSGGVFSFSWPAGLEVEVMPDGSVSWALTPEFDLMGDGSCYKVGAAIVKGSTASNIYYYGPDGATGDMGLFPPINASGTPSALSNLTFCFTECKEKEPVYISVKAFYRDNEGKINATASTGDYFATCSRIGYNKYPEISSFDMHHYWFWNDVGDVTVTESGNNLIINVNLLTGYQLFETYFYVGSLEGLESTIGEDGCPDYDGNPLWILDKTFSNTVTYIVPY